MSGVLSCGRDTVIVNVNDCSYCYPGVNPVFSFFVLFLMNFISKCF